MPFLAPAFEEVFEQLRNSGNTSIPYSRTIGAIKATNVRELEVAWITVQKSATIQTYMKEQNIEPYILPGRRALHKKQSKESLTSSEDESMEKIEYQ